MRVATLWWISLTQSGGACTACHQELVQVPTLQQTKADSINAIDEIAKRLPESLDYMVVRESACDERV